MFRCPARTVGFSGTPLLVYSQPTKLSDAQVLPISWLGGSTRGLQPGGHVHKEAVHLLSLQPASITSSSAFKPECNSLSQYREDTGGPSMPVREFNLKHARQSNRAEKHPSRPGFEPRRARAISLSGQQALWPIRWPRPLSHRGPGVKCSCCQNRTIGCEVTDDFKKLDRRYITL